MVTELNTQLHDKEGELRIARELTVPLQSAVAELQQHNQMLSEEVKQLQLFLAQQSPTPQLPPQAGGNGGGLEAGGVGRVSSRGRLSARGSVRNSWRGNEDGWSGTLSCSSVCARACVGIRVCMVSGGALGVSVSERVAERGCGCGCGRGSCFCSGCGCGCGCCCGCAHRNSCLLEYA